MGSVNARCDRWRWLAPEAKHLHNDILARGWCDPKLDPSFDCSAHQGRRHTGPVTEARRPMGQMIDKLSSLGVVAPVDPSETLTNFPTHVMSHGLAPKLDDDDGTRRTDIRRRKVVHGKHASSNEQVPHFQGPSDHDFASFLEPESWLMKCDARKFFHQFRAR